MGWIGINQFGIALRFFGWWFGEMSALVPPALKRRFARTSGWIVLFPEDGSTEIYFDSNQDMGLLGRVAFGSETPAELRVLLRRYSLDQDVAGGRVGVCLRVPVAKSLRTEFELPLAAEGNLNQVVSFELDRYTPYRAEQVLFSSRILERSFGTCIPLGGGIAAGVIDEDMTDHAGGDGEKMLAVANVQFLRTHQPQIGLMDNRRARERGLAGFQPQIVAGEPLQFVVNQRNQFL